MFIISQDSEWHEGWYCGDGAGNCRGSDAPGIRMCEEESGSECGTFARGRTVKWKNGINLGKKNSRFKKK